jgi:RNA polymerase sigma factor for flagellar operon FliA
MSGNPVDQKRLAERHLPLVRSLAMKLKDQMPGHLALEDLLGYGSAGLMEAAERYDPSRDIAFSTFAHYRIRGAMVDGLREMGGLSRAVVRRNRAAALADEYLENARQREAGADPALRARARAGASTADTLRTLSEHVTGLTTIVMVSLDSEFSPDSADLQADEELDRVNYTWLAPRVKQALDQLPERERRLMEDCYFGDLCIKEAGEKQGLSKSWASRLHARAIKRLGHLLGGAFDRSP